MSLNIKPQETKKIKVFSQGTDHSKTLRCETLYIADYEHINISSFAVLYMKLWLETDGDLNIDHPLYSLYFEFIQPKAQNCYKMLSSFSHYFIFNITNLENFSILIISMCNYKSFIYQNLQVVSLLGRKFDSFSHLGFENQSNFDY